MAKTGTSKGSSSTVAAKIEPIEITNEPMRFRRLTSGEWLMIGEKSRSDQPFKFHKGLLGQVVFNNRAKPIPDTEVALSFTGAEIVAKDLEVYTHSELPEEVIEITFIEFDHQKNIFCKKVNRIPVQSADFLLLLPDGTMQAAWKE